MTTPSLTKRAPDVHALRAARNRNPKSADGTERIDRPYDLADTAYRVILGCCTQERINSTNQSWPFDAGQANNARPNKGGEIMKNFTYNDFRSLEKCPTSPKYMQWESAIWCTAL